MQWLNLSVFNATKCVRELSKTETKPRKLKVAFKSTMFVLNLIVRALSKPLFKKDRLATLSHLYIVSI